MKFIIYIAIALLILLLLNNPDLFFFSFFSIAILCGILYFNGKSKQNIEQIYSAKTYDISDYIDEEFLSNFDYSSIKTGKYLVVDLETTGLNAANSDIVQIAWVLLDKDLKFIEFNSFIIKQTKKVPIAAYEIHGIDKETSIKYGVEKSYAFEKFLEVYNNSKYIVGHNIDFDYSFLIHHIKELVPKTTICTMKRSTSYCEIPKYYGKGYKWPTLDELFGVLFLKTTYINPREKHSADIDVKITAKCFIMLKEIGVIKRP